MQRKLLVKYGLSNCKNCKAISHETPDIAFRFTNVMQQPSQKRCEILTDGQYSCSIVSIVLFKAQTCNVAEALYLNKQFSHLFLILGATRWKA